MLPLYMKDGVQKIKTAPVHQYIPQSYTDAQQAVYMGKTLAEITNMTPFTRGQYVPVLVTNKGQSQARYSKRKPSVADTHARRSKSRHMVNIPRNSKASFEGARTGSMVFGNPSYGEVVSGTEGWANYKWDKATGIITYTEIASGNTGTIQPNTAQHTAVVNAVSWTPTSTGSTGTTSGGQQQGGQSQGSGFNWNQLATDIFSNLPGIITAGQGGGTQTTGADVPMTTTTTTSGVPSYMQGNGVYGQSKGMSVGTMVAIAGGVIGALIFLPRIIRAVNPPKSNPRRRRRSSKRRSRK
jgi:hypothetical protein